MSRLLISEVIGRIVPDSVKYEPQQGRRISAAPRMTVLFSASAAENFLAESKGISVSPEDETV